MPYLLSQETIRKLLGTLHESIKSFVDSYASDGIKINSSVVESITNIQKGLLADIEKAKSKNSDLSLTICDDFLGRLTRIAEAAEKKAKGFFVDNNDLLEFSRKLKELSLKLTKVQEGLSKTENAELLIKNQKTEQESDVKEIREQLQTITGRLDETTERLDETLKQLNTTKKNVLNLGRLLETVRVQADEETFDELASAFQQLGLQALPKKLIKNSPTVSKFYFPFPEHTEDKFGIEGFDAKLLRDIKHRENIKQLETWKKQSDNLRAYEKLKLSECVYADMYAAIVELAELLKKCTTNQSAKFQPDPTLKPEIQNMISNLIENWDQSWSFCKKTIIIPAIKEDGTPTLLKSCLENISAYDHKNDFVPNNLYPSRGLKIQTLLSLICYKDPNEEKHFLPKLEAAIGKLESQLKQIEQNAQESKEQVLSH